MIIQQLGGELSASSEPGVGSAFSFTIPLTEKADESILPLERVNSTDYHSDSDLFQNDDSPFMRDL